MKQKPKPESIKDIMDAYYFRENKEEEIQDFILRNITEYIICSLDNKIINIYETAAYVKQPLNEWTHNPITGEPLYNNGAYKSLRVDMSHLLDQSIYDEDYETATILRDKILELDIMLNNMV